MSEEKKIIIDEDWKSQVEAEKEAATQERSEPAEQPVPEGTPPQMPPASFEMLLTTLATEAMIGMGQIPLHGVDQPQVNLDQARYAIDMLEVLKEKTSGNLSSEEDDAITNVLHQLRMAFISAQAAHEG